MLDMNTNILVGTGIAWSTNFLLAKLETPFMDLYFEDKLIKFPQIKKFFHLIRYIEAYL
jgi:hypothetical protein